MVKLSAAKCPSCGADIEVNEKLEKTICQYCGTTILIEDAVQKYNLEVSGKVEVDGIIGRNGKFIQAKKHIEINELNEATALLNEIVENDKFDVEAYCELLKIDLKKLDEKYNLENVKGSTAEKTASLIDEAEKYYERIQKIDKEGIAKKELEEYMDSMNYYLDFTNSDKYVELGNELNRVFEIEDTVPDEYKKEWKNTILQKYFPNAYGSIINSKFNGEATKNSEKNRRNLRIYRIQQLEELNTFEDIQEKIKSLEEETKEYVIKVNEIITQENKKRLEEKNKQIKKKNKETNKIIRGLKSSKRGATICLVFSIIAIIVLIFFTIMFFTSGIGIGILFLIVNSWLISKIIKLVIEKVNDIKQYKKSIEEQQKNLIIQK